MEKAEESDGLESNLKTQNLEIGELDDDMNAMISKIKGDAIGQTLYSERFVLRTLLELKNVTNEIKMTEEFEKDLCLLWDMTIEKEVVQLLLTHSVIDMFTSIIETTEDERLIEILLGIIGNCCCCLSEARDYLCTSPQLVSVILGQISSTDPLILVQLMRLLHSMIVFENCEDERAWFQHFADQEDFVMKFSFILNSSTSNTLLTNCYEALNSICAKFSVIECQVGIKDSRFSNMFVKPCLVEGLVESFKQLVPEISETDLKDETSIIPTQNVLKVMNLFLEVSVILSQYDATSSTAFDPIADEFFKCVSRILTPLTEKMFLFPLSSAVHQSVIENINDLQINLNDPFSCIFPQMVIIWSLIDNHKNEQEAKTSSKSEWSDDEEIGSTIDADEICMTILEYATRCCFLCSQENFDLSVKTLPEKTVKQFLERLDNGSEEPEIVSLVEKLKNSLKNIWKQEAQ